MRRWTSAILPGLLGAGWLGCLLGPLLAPGRALANRDIAVFHLPLRASFLDLAKFGLPVWNPWIHGGQPILSNPNYGAFYPPSWLIFVVPPEYALSLMAVLHAALAFAGAWRLARHFGCGRGAAALAGVGYVGCGAYLTLLSAYTLLGGMSWLPWILTWADQSLRLPAGERWWRPGLLAGGALGLQLLNGEPSTVVISGLGLLALTASAAGRRLAAAPRVLLPLLFAVALAAVQLLPTLGRLADSPRKELPPRIAMLWSMPPERLVEIIFPRFFGDPKRDIMGLFFGWNLNDRDYPYIESLYPGLLLAILGMSALLRWRIPRRAAWALALAGGCLLAIGRHNPLYGWLRETIPVLAVLRYPEKFILLAVVALLFAGILGWQRLLDDREAGRPQSSEFPLLLALVVLATALALTGFLFQAPRAALWFITSHTAPGLPAATLSTALTFLQSEAWKAVGTAGAVVTLLLLCRWRRPSRSWLEALAVLLLAADLWHYGHSLLQTLPVEAFRTPSPAAAGLLPVRDRIFVQETISGTPQVFRRRGDPQAQYTRTFLDNLDPYAGLLWRIPYAFDTDFDKMLTGWGQKANGILSIETTDPQMMYRYLGVWNVGTVFLQKTFREQVAALKDPAAMPMRKAANTYVLPRFRFAPRVTFHPDHAAALAAARAEGWEVFRHEHWIRPGSPETSRTQRWPPRLGEVTDHGGRIRVRYRAGEETFFVAAMTYDPGWRASVGGKRLATYPTAACQLGVVLPAGEDRLVLEYREPLLGVGIAVTLLALAAGAGILLGPGQRQHRA